MSETTAQKSSERTLVDVQDLRVAFASDSSGSSAATRRSSRCESATTSSAVAGSRRG